MAFLTETARAKGVTEDVEVCFQVVVTVSVIGTKPVVGKKFCGGIVKRGCQSIGSGYAASSVGTPTGSAVPAVTSSGSIDCEGRNIWREKMSDYLANRSSITITFRIFPE